MPLFVLCCCTRYLNDLFLLLFDILILLDISWNLSVNFTNVLVWELLMQCSRRFLWLLYGIFFPCVVTDELFHMILICKTNLHKSIHDMLSVRFFPYKIKFKFKYLLGVIIHLYFNGFLYRVSTHLPHFYDVTWLIF